ncbi:MAG: GNAT family N-acetyltransferase [Chloroflexi bacterium]|nr:GNAT family N-acetyltransferase [Chloroflexota bacterium]
MTNNIFLTPYWQKTWWESIRPAGQELRIVKLMEGDMTIGIAPLVKNQGTITFLGGTDLWDIHDFIVLKGQEEGFFHALMDYLEDEEWTEVKLESLLEGSPTLRRLPPLAQDKGHKVEQREEDHLMGVALPGNWEEYLTGLRKKDRHELRRKLRHLETGPAFRIQQLNDAHSVSNAIDEFLNLMGQSREEKSRFLTTEREAFFRDMSLDLARRGLFQLFFLEMDGVRTAGTVCFDYNNVRSLYNSGYNTEYAALGTGFLLKALCLKKAICEGKTYFDLLRGTEPYKHHLGAKEQGLYRLSILR